MGMVKYGIKKKQTTEERLPDHLKSSLAEKKQQFPISSGEAKNERRITSKKESENR